VRDGIRQPFAAMIVVDRVSARTLRIAIGRARAAGTGWHELAVTLNMSATALRRGRRHQGRSRANVGAGASTVVRSRSIGWHSGLFDLLWHDDDGAMERLLMRELGASRGRVLTCVEALALVAAGEGRHQRALLLLAATKRLRETPGSATTASWQGRLAAATAMAGAASGTAGSLAAATGRGLSMDQAITYAMHDTLDAPGAGNLVNPLTKRETEIARLVAAGATTRQIASELMIGTRTVENHLARTLTKLGLANRAQLAHWVAIHVPTSGKN
jgi:DNA-binding NarL/FixJ family response regulator